MSISGTRAFLCAPMLAFPIAVVLGACAPMPTKTTLLASNLDLTVPTGPVHLPSIKDGYGVQGFLTLSANQHRWRELGRPDEDFDISGIDVDTVVFESPFYARLPAMVASGEGSIVLGGLMRLYLGGDFTQRQTFWFGTGFFRTGKNWHGELDAAIGKVGTERHEIWRDEQIGDICDQDSCYWGTDPEIMVVDFAGTPMFWKVGIDVAHVKTGILAGYQLVDLPVTKSPNGNGFSLLTHTFTLGCFKPTRLGTFSLFAQTTNLGETWSPSAKLQYSVIIGGEKNPDSERTK